MPSAVPNKLCIQRLDPDSSLPWSAIITPVSRRPRDSDTVSRGARSLDRHPESTASTTTLSRRNK